MLTIVARQRRGIKYVYISITIEVTMSIPVRTTFTRTVTTGKRRGIENINVIIVIGISLSCRAKIYHCGIARSQRYVSV